MRTGPHGTDEERPPDSVKRRGRSHTGAPSGSRLYTSFEMHRRDLRVSDMEREQAFSWQYCVVSVFSYALMLSDIFRTGFGIRSLHQYHTLEPDTYVYFGPYVYGTHHLTTANATSEPVKFWPYKYDTTSITMRAAAEYLHLEAWPPCVLYKSRCDEATSLTRAHVFRMVEALVDAVAQHPGSHAGRSRGSMTLRSDTEYKDRVYHYALPWLFNHSVKRTSQLIHYTYDASRTLPLKPLCRVAKPARRPYSCDQSWTNLQRVACLPRGPCSYPAASVWDHILAREGQLAAAYPNHTIDFVVLDGMEDFTRSGLAYQGRKYYEVVVLTRLRKCDNTGGCLTVAIDDYRYEAATFVMDAPSWYGTLSILRGVAQLYAWSRLLLLVVATFVARTREERFHGTPLVSRLVITARTVFLVPSQVVIYGSAFPVGLYVIAHLIDSPAEYELAFAYFMSTLGQMHWNLRELIRHCAISMRSVWLLGIVTHCIVALTTSSSWSPIHGIPGLTEFSVTFVAAITIFAQVRSLSFRCTRVLQTHEVIPSAVRYPRLAEMTDRTHMTINNLVGGTHVDVQCLLSGFLALLGLTVVIWALHRVAPRLQPLVLAFTSTTIAPYSAGTLWSRNRLVVTWYGNVFNVDTTEKPAVFIRQVAVQPRDASMVVEPRTNHGLDVFQSFKQAHQLYRRFVSLPNKALVMRDTPVSHQLQLNMHSLDMRTRAIESTVYLINLAAMSDPITFFGLRISGGRLVALYRSRVTHRCFLLPSELRTSDTDLPIDWEDMVLIAIVNSIELDWEDLLRCG